MKHLGTFGSGNGRIQAYLIRFGGDHLITLIPPEKDAAGAYYIGLIDVKVEGVYPGTESDYHQSIRRQVEDWLLEQGIIQQNDDGGFDSMIIPRLVREKRLEHGLTQQALGEKMGYKDRTAELTVQFIESGRRFVPRDKIRALAEALGISTDDLIP